MNAPTRTLVYLLALAFAAIAIPWAATFVNALLLTSDRASDTVETRLDIVGNGIVGDVAAYLATGIPLRSVVGMQDYLDSALDGTDEVRFALVSTLNGTMVGKYLNPDHRMPGSDKFAATTDWQALGLRSVDFSISTGGQVVGQLLIAYDAGVAPASALALGWNFVTVLATALIIGFEVLLVGYREVVGLPLATVVALDRRVAGRLFDRIATTPDGGPLQPMTEALNRLVAAVNDRYVRMCAYIAEIGELSFNPAAAGMVAALRTRLDASARFAPERLANLNLDFGDMFAGPTAFRAGVVAGIAVELAAPGLAAILPLLALPPGAEWPAALVLFAGVTAVFTRILVRFAFRFRLVAGAAVAVIGIAMLPFPAGIPSLFAALAVVAGIGLVASLVMPTQAFAAIARIAHGLAGIAAGCGIVAIDAGRAGTHLFSLAAAVVAVVATMLLALRFGSRGRAAAPARPAGMPALARAVLAVLPGWLFWAAAGYWLALTLAGIGGGGQPPAVAVLIGGACAAAGATATLGILLRVPVRFGAEGALLIAAVVLAVITLDGRMSPFTGLAAAISAMALGIGVVGAMARDVGRSPFRTGVAAGVALAVGALAAVLVQADAVPAPGVILAAVLAAAAGLLVATTLAQAGIARWAAGRRR